MSDRSPMRPKSDLAKIMQEVRDLRALVERQASTPIRHALIDGPVTVARKGEVTAKAPDGSITTLSPDGFTAASEDGKTVVVAAGDVLVQAAPGEPWLPLDQGAIDDAAEALASAQAAQDTADDKSTIVRSPNDAPGGPQPDYSAGDEWRKVDGGFVTALWQHDGTIFQPQVLKGTMLSADAIDGKTITGATVQTSALANRGVKVVNAGLIGYDAAGNVKTVVDASTGKITAVDGTFTGTVTGSAIVGGGISIAQGTASTTDQTFEAASGTTAPTGWTRQVVTTYGAGGISFLTSGGNPGRRAQFRMVEVPSGQSTLELLYPTAVDCIDSYVAFDYKWDGTTDLSFIDPSIFALKLRAKVTDAALTSPPDPFLSIRAGSFSFSSANDTTASVLPSVGSIPENVWHRVEVTLRGQGVTVKVTPAGGPAYPVWTTTLTRAATSGRVEFMAYSGGFFGGAGGADQVSWIDNVHIEALKTGLFVAPDGGTTVERLIVNQLATVPEPTTATDATTKGYVDQTRSYQRAQATVTTVTSTSGSPTVLNGLSLTVASASLTAIYEATMESDVLLNNAMTNVILLYVDGTAIPNPQLVTAGPATLRLPGRKTVYVTGLAVGNHTIQMRSYNTAAGVSATVDQHSQLIIKRIS
jgi:hypothetical protein